MSRYPRDEARPQSDAELARVTRRLRRCRWPLEAGGIQARQGHVPGAHASGQFPGQAELGLPERRTDRFHVNDDGVDARAGERRRRRRSAAAIGSPPAGAGGGPAVGHHDQQRAVAGGPGRGGSQFQGGGDARRPAGCARRSASSARRARATSTLPVGPQKDVGPFASERHQTHQVPASVGVGQQAQHRPLGGLHPLGCTHRSGRVNGQHDQAGGGLLAAGLRGRRPAPPGASPGRRPPSAAMRAAA